MRLVRRRSVPDRASPAYRSFDPRRVGTLECRAWVSYYRRDWARFLRAAVGLTRHTFGLPWAQTLYGSWLVLRANQLWAGVDNDPDRARRTMERFYTLLQATHDAAFDPSVAAALEIEWWRVHREQQRDGSRLGEPALIDALAALYAYVYAVPEADVRRAGEQRTLAMRHSDQWVAEGCNVSSPRIADERAALVRSYAALLSAVHLA